MGIIWMNPPSAYFMAKGSRLWKVEAMSKLELMKEASDNGTMVSGATAKVATWHSF